MYLRFWVRVEIDWRIFIGYCAARNGKAVHPCIYNVQEAQEFFPEVDFAGTDELSEWWMTWDLLGFSVNENEDTPNFQEVNDAFFSLYRRNGI